MTRFSVAIEPDERGFWHVNAYIIHDDPGDDGDVPDAFATTKKGASLDDAIALARKNFSPEKITIWEPCEECGGTGLNPDATDEICDECEDGMQPHNLTASATADSQSAARDGVNTKSVQDKAKSEDAGI
jgi:hypothetical protein